MPQLPVDKGFAERQQKPLDLPVRWYSPCLLADGEPVTVHACDPALIKEV
jgi:hypothetical protein